MRAAVLRCVLRLNPNPSARPFYLVPVITSESKDNEKHCARVRPDASHAGGHCGHTASSSTMYGFASSLVLCSANKPPNHFSLA